MNKLVKVGLVVMLVIGVVGCNTTGSVMSNNNIINNKKSGVIYGVAGIDNKSKVSELCLQIDNKDERCKEADKYVLVTVFSKVGYASGPVGVNALVKKDFIGIHNLNFNGRTGDKNAPYVKAMVVPNQLGEVLEIASVNGDGKCNWSGMPRIGGTVCPAYNYDYTKDFTGVVFP